MNWIPKIAAIVCIAALAITGCGAMDEYNDDRGKGDGPVTDTDDTGAHVINFPNDFSNAAVKCWGKNGIYQTTQNANGKEMVVVPDDPMCDTPDGTLAEGD